MEQKPVRILHVLSRMDFGGAEALLMNLYRITDRTKIQFDFAVSANQEAPYDREILEMGGRIIRYPRYTVKNHREYCRWWNEFFAKEGNDYKIIHGHIGSTAAIYLKIAKKYGKITIAHSHGQNEPIDSAKALAYRVYSFPTRFIADYFIGCSKEALFDRFGKKVASNKDKAFVLYNGIDTSRYAYNEEVRLEKRRELGIEDDKLVLGHVGRCTKAKNPFFMIGVFDEVHKRNPNTVLLRIGKGELEEEIDKKIEELNLKDSIIHISETPHINQYLQAMDIFLFPSIFEGLSLAVIEAQSSGLPVIASDSITEEHKKTDLVKFLPLEKGEEFWASELLKTEIVDRKGYDVLVANAGLDIKGSMKKLQNLYNKILNI